MLHQLIHHEREYRQDLKLLREYEILHYRLCLSQKQNLTQARKALAAFRADVRAKITALLTDEQRAQLPKKGAKKKKKAAASN